MSAAQLGFECLGYLTAQQFGCKTPDFGIVSLSPEFISANAEVYAGLGFRPEPGPAFASFMVPNFSPVVPNSRIRPDHHDAAARVYALDLVVQNPDRRKVKTNCGYDSTGALVVFDFETSFSFCAPGVLFAPPPWEVDKLAFHRDHVFYSGLCGLPIDWEWVHAAITGVQESVMEWVHQLPNGWCPSSAEIVSHFSALQPRSAELVASIIGTLK